MAAHAGPAPADPLDDLDSMLGSARSMRGSARKAPTSARELIAAGFSRLLAPLRSARKAGGEAEWARQMSTPRSWGASSGGCHLAGGKAREGDRRRNRA